MQGNGKSMTQVRQAGDENLTGCLQKYIVYGYERKRNDVHFKYKQQGVAKNSQGV
jgi:hypothetical protein